MSETGGLNSCCLSGHLHTGTPVGKEEKVGELDCYVSPSPDGSKKKVIIYLTDIFGWKFNNARLLADQYAKHAGAYVYMPHYLATDPIPAEDVKILEPNLDDREKLSVADKAKNTAHIATTLGPFMVSNREAVVLPRINAFVEHIRTDPAVGKIGAVGFCFGGRYAIIMAHEGSKVDAAVANHPAMLGLPADLDPVKKPLSIALGDQDSHVPKDTVDKIIDIMEKKLDLDKEIVIYPGQIHGFAVRGDQTSEETKEAMDKVARQTVAWFNKYLA